MENYGYKTRIAEKELKKKLRAFGAVSIEGPKWCGKTWLSLNSCKSNIFIDDPSNNFQNKRRAEMSPELVLDGTEPRLIDEWQLVPPIWDAVRHKVDKNQKSGQFLLTGSTRPKQFTTIHSGAGRIGKLRLHTMSLYETGDSSGKVSLSRLFTSKLKAIDTGEVTIKDIIGFIIRGGWPGSLNLEPDEAAVVPKDYLEKVIDEDINEGGFRKKNSIKVRMLLRSLARNESTIAGKKTLVKDIKEEDEVSLSIDSVNAYLEQLDRLYLLNDQSAFNPNIRSSVRVGKSSKHHFVDVSLAAAALGATHETLYYDLNTLGFLFEALCEHDLKIYVNSIGGELFHYRDGVGREVDAVVQLDDGRWGAFEIKLGANQIDEAAMNLIRIRELMEEDSTAKPPSVLVVVCGLTNFAYQRPDGVFVVPITALRP